jgi:transcriptional regulator with XRE-family HTH domain
MTINTRRDFAERIEEIKRDRHFAKELQIIKEGSPRLTTDADVAKLLGVSQPVLNRYRNRERFPRLPDALRMAEKTRASLDWLSYRPYVVRGLDLTGFEEMLRNDEAGVDKICKEIEKDPEFRRLGILEKLAKAIEIYKALKESDPFNENRIRDQLARTKK